MSKDTANTKQKLLAKINVLQRIFMASFIGFFVVIGYLFLNYKSFTPTQSNIAIALGLMLFCASVILFFSTLKEIRKLEYV
ncbi:MAG: hypothetical protein WC253_04650 [Sulfurovaceae bacterium]